MVKRIDEGNQKTWRGRLGGTLILMLSIVQLSVAAENNSESMSLWSKGQHFQTEGESVSIMDDGIHDPRNDTIKVLQEPTESMANFPRDAAGIIDWVKVLEDGMIAPRTSVSGEGEMFPVDFDVIFKNTGSMPNVRFPHKQHTEWLTCANCHPYIFIPQQGANPVSMSAIVQGEYCGVCHGKVAFPPTLHCGRCHSVPSTSLRR